MKKLSLVFLMLFLIAGARLTFAAEEVKQIISVNPLGSILNSIPYITGYQKISSLDYERAFNNRTTFVLG